MKRLKGFIVYGVIILLSVAVLAGYLIKKGSSGDSATAGNANAVLSDSDQGKQKHVEEVMKKGIAEPDPNPVIGIGRGEDYTKVTDEAVNNAGGLKDIIKKGDVVLIKPNICTRAMAVSPRITDYHVVQEIADMAVGLGASKIIVAEGTIAGNAFSRGFLVFNEYDKVKGVELFDLNGCSEEDCYKLKPQKSLTGTTIYIPKIYMDADVVITIAKLKTHCVTTASLSLKNSIGVPPGQIYGVGSKDGLHTLGIDQAIIDINRIRKPDFAIIEGIVGGEGNGPLTNTPVKSDIIFAGKDLVALDTVALTFMGFKVDEISHVKLAGEEKLGISDLSKIEVVGADLDSIKMSFMRAYAP